MRQPSSRKRIAQTIVAITLKENAPTYADINTILEGPCISGQESMKSIFQGKDMGRFT